MNYSEKFDIENHKKWINYLKPQGLVVSPQALVRAGILIPQSCRVEQEEFIPYLSKLEIANDTKYAISNLKDFLRSYLGYKENEIKSAESIGYFLDEYSETLGADYIIQFNSVDEILVKEISTDQDFDAVPTGTHDGWKASEHDKFERLMRERKFSVGLISNQTSIRLVYAPRGETSGFITFVFDYMTEVAGRSIFWAFRELLHSKRFRLFKVENKDLPSILFQSRQFQNDVSIKLSGQVLIALYDLLRGFQGADKLVKGELFSDLGDDELDLVYEGLITVLLRTVFILYVEDREMASNDSFYSRYYSLRGLFTKLQEDRATYAEVMDQRYGAWGHLISLYRVYYEGAEFKKFKIPKRSGYLFDPRRFPFLEGISDSDQPEIKKLPLVSDKTVWAVLEKLLILNGELISYRTLDVEQIGSVYETLMGFEAKRTKGRSIAINATSKKNNVPSILDVDYFLSLKKVPDRKKYFAETTGHKLTKKNEDELKSLSSIEDVQEWLGKKRNTDAVPNYVPVNSLMFYPTEERRNSGSHYTPRELTAPIVSEALQPILKNLGEHPKPDQILDLKICDPAMGSGAFLVEACRQIGDELVKSWHYWKHPDLKSVDPGEGEILLARRKIAQRCLYGVDKNQMAVDLAKLSIWLITLSKNEDFSFLDHALKHGDSLLGLSNKQIQTMSLELQAPLPLEEYFSQAIEEAILAREEIQDDPRTHTPESLEKSYLEYYANMSLLRKLGNLMVKVFFVEKNYKSGTKELEVIRDSVQKILKKGKVEHVELFCDEALKDLDPKLSPFHWELEFPEVFNREIPGFDSLVGNPPFLGGRGISERFGTDYSTILSLNNFDISGDSDLVAHFFRRGISLIRKNGTLAFLSTKSIYQGATRESSLEKIIEQGAHIYFARRRFVWPGNASVIVCVVCIFNGEFVGEKVLDNKNVDNITSYLLDKGPNTSPFKLASNKKICYQGSITFGMGFTFENEPKGYSNSLEQMKDIIRLDLRNQTKILPYIGGSELTDSPKHSHSRYCIDFGVASEEHVKLYPAIYQILKERVKPDRDKKSAEVKNYPWWQHWRPRVELYQCLDKVTRVLATNAQASPYHSLAFLPKGMVYANSLNIFLFDKYFYFALLQSNIHEVWVRFLSSSLKDDLRYNPTDCFETFPFPSSSDIDENLEKIGEAYYLFRAGIMAQNNEGLTKTYSRFHDPEETQPQVQKLRELHSKMDKVVLEAYGWTDLKLEYDFILSYEEEDQDELSNDSFNKGKKSKKKPFRLKFKPELHDEILARLLKLNQERFLEEQRNG